MYAFGGYMFFLPNPPKPEIKQAEFPFRLEYEIEGETKIVEDVLICKFSGFASNEAEGKYRTWKSYFKSGNTRITLLRSDEMEIYYKPNLNPQIAGAYYMGDTEVYTSINETFPDALYTDDYEKIDGILLPRFKTAFNNNTSFLCDNADCISPKQTEQWVAYWVN